MKIDTAYEFLKSSPLPVIGVSSTGKSFGTSVYKTLLGNGFDVVPVNPKMEVFEGKKCYPDIKSVNGKPVGVIFAAKPENTRKSLDDCKEAGVTKIWFNRGAQSDEAVKFCKENGIEAYTGNCVLMFAGGFPHNFHLFLMKLFGKID